MAVTSCKILTWNIAWRRLPSPAASELRRRIDAESPDVICVTEGHEDFLPAEGFTITSSVDYGYPQKPGRRKALLWSRQPWVDVDDLGDKGMPSGRFIRGTTETPVGSLDVIGVCIPWQHAHVSGGRRDRAPWQDHLLYLDGLEKVLRQSGGLKEAVIVGDYNQHMPRRTAPRRVADRLTSTLGATLTIPTRGTVPEIGRQSVDHLAHTKELAAVEVRGLSNVGVSGNKLSDHFGLVVNLVAG